MNKNVMLGSKLS